MAEARTDHGSGAPGPLRARDLLAAVVPRPGPRSVASARVGAGVVVLVGAIALARSASVLDRLWAEDGQVFLGGAVRDGVASWASAYAGYLHLAPRLVASAVAPLGVERAPLWYAVATAVVTALVALGAFVGLGYFVHQRWRGAALALAVPLVPVLGGESIASIANLQFVALFGLFWLLLVPVRTVGGEVLVVVAAGIVALSTPLAFLFAPLALALALGHRERRHVVVLGVLAVGVAVQLVVYATVGDDRSVGAAAAVSGRGLVSLPTQLARPLVPDSLQSSPVWLVPLASAAVVLVALGVMAWRSLRAGEAPEGRTVVALLASVYAGLFLLASYLLGGTVTPRYQVLPSLLLVTAALAAPWPRRDPDRRAPGVLTIAALGVLAPVTVAAVADFVPSELRRSGAAWSDTVERGEAECAPGETIELPVAPELDDGPWGTVEVPCSELDVAAPPAGSRVLP